MNEFDFNRFVNGHVLPPIGPYPKGENPGFARSEFDMQGMFAPARKEVTQFGTPQVMPLKIKLSSEDENAWWLLPCECLISVNSKNILAKRNVAKSKLRGSIKERWAQDDYSISIQGLFTKKDSYEYPEADLKKLRNYCEARETIDVLCPLFEIFKITRMVIESYDIPHTKGEENQNWTIQALSDDDWNLLLTIDDIGKNVL